MIKKKLSLLFRCRLQVVIEYGAIDGSSSAFNSPNFKPASIVSALSVLDEVTKQPQNPTVVSYSKFNGPNYDDSDAATPLLLTIAKIFGNISVYLIKLKLTQYL